jgi:PhoPQ-activated pathogenicity-related protein
MPLLRHLLVCSCLLLSLSAFAAEPLYPNGRATEANATALDRYVAAPDDAYAWELVSTKRTPEWTGYIIKLTSQRWRSPEEVDRVLWEHYLSIVVPKQVDHETGMMMIGGGSNRGDAPTSPDILVVDAAKTSNSVCASISQIPNQPLSFSDEDGRNRGEDSLIAYTWDKFMRTGDENWPLRLPMTKAVVRAMDAVQEFCASEAGGGITVKDFVVVGASKRGWTTWTTGIVDARAKAIIPMVIDLLNIIPSFRHHQAVYGFWAPAIDDYQNMHIMDRMETPEYKALMEIVEPYEYLERLDMPKYLVSAAQDQFFLPDSAQFYIDELPGPTWMRCTQNIGHGLIGSDAPKAAIAFYRTFLKGEKLPEYDWSFPDANTIRVTTDTPPIEVKLWQATNPKTRDFRIDEVGQIYKSTDLVAQEDGSYVAQVETPPAGWTAYMIELAFPGADGTTLKFSTPIRVVPETTPHTYVPVEDPETGYLTK